MPYALVSVYVGSQAQTRKGVCIMGDFIIVVLALLGFWIVAPHLEW